MRMAFVSSMEVAPWGGSEYLWSDTAGRLLASGHTVLACVPSWPDMPSRLVDLHQRGAILECRRRPSFSIWARGSSWLKRRLGRKEDRNAAWERIRGFRPDVVCISNGATMCGIDWMLRCLQAGVPYASICHSNYEYWWPDDERAEVVRRAYRGCVRSYFVSDRNRRLLETQLGEPLASAEVVRNPFNVAYDAAPDWPAASKTFRLACVGRLEPKAKGQDLILEVLSKDKWRQRPLEVSFVGAGPCEGILRRLVTSHRLESTVRFVGHIADVESIWKTHHALVLPSRYEGLPLAVVEAMLCGRTSIVTDVAGNSEVVDDNVSGFIATMPSTASLDEAMERAWSRRGEWQGIGRLAATSIRERVPSDPAATFADKLLGLVGVGKSDLAGAIG